MLKKNKRIVDRALLDSYHNKPCEVCGTTYGTVGHHIKTKKTGGHDLGINLLALCQKHHNEIHNGLITFVDKYVDIKFVLQKKGWVYCDISRAWLNSDAGS